MEIFGLELADPLTFVTDVLMSVVAFYCGHKLFYSFDAKFAKLTGLFFLFLGLSSLIGGTSHLLDLYFGKMPHLFAWMTQGLSILFVELACVTLIKSRKIQNLLRMVIYSFFGVFVSQLISIQQFNVVKINATVGLIGFTSMIHIVKYFETKDQDFLNVPLSICLFILPAIIHGFDLRYNSWVNQNVLSHLVLLPCYYLLYRSFFRVTEKMITSKTQPALQ
ncbi:MAG: hypothetical protein ACJAT1_002333 [Marivirga sp.]|jgi:hypothetical protein